MLGIILVNYRSIEETVAYVRDELSKVSVPFRLVIVNNAATATHSQILADQLNAEAVAQGNSPTDLSKINYVLSVKENEGYARGNNLGAEFLSDHFEIDWLLITNNDLRIQDQDTVTAMIHKLQDDPKIGVIGPRIVGLDGIDQSPGRRLGLWSHLIFPRLLYPFFALFMHLGFGRETIRNATEGSCYRVMGSFVMVRAAAFDAANGFDPATFLFAEELILSERMSKAGYITYYYPHKTVVHAHSQVISSHFKRKQIQAMVLGSLLYYYQNYRNASAWEIMLAKFSFQFYFAIYEPILNVFREAIRRFREKPKPA